MTFTETWRAHCPQPTSDRHMSLCTSLTCYDKYVDLEYEGPDGPQVVTFEQWDAENLDDEPDTTCRCGHPDCGAC